jgi:DNA (cytosine-5)-methyltransferase 1
MSPSYGKVLKLGVVYSFESKGTVAMAMNYDKLWKLLIDKKMNRTDLHKQAHISTNAIAAMGKGEDVSTKVLNKICKTLDCEIEDIVTCVREENE